jgi:hypothetical protein
MPKKLNNDPNADHRPVLILVRPTRRGYIVEAAGSNDPFACKDGDDIGEAIIEILNDPETDRVSEEAAAESRNARARASAPEPEDEGDEEEYEPAPDGGGGTTSADDIIAGALHMLLEKGRKASSWRSK